MERIDKPRGNGELRVSETFRGHTIYYAPATRSWLVQLATEPEPSAFASAFQARRAINLQLDGRSVSWPRKEGA